MNEINSIYAIKVTQGLTATYVVISEDKTILAYCMLFNIKVLFSMSITKDVHKWLVLQRFFLARKLQSSVLYVGKSSLLLATKAEVEGF